MLASALEMVLLFTSRQGVTHRKTYRNLRVRFQRRLRQTDIIEEAVTVLRILYSVLYLCSHNNILHFNVKNEFEYIK